MSIECKLEKRTSKAGNEYYCLYIPSLEKVVFLEPAEVKLLLVLNHNDSKQKGVVYVHN